MYAVIRAGGRQYKVASGDVIEVDRLGASEGDEVTFAPTLVVDDGSVKSSAGDLQGLTVTGKVVGHKRGEKIRVFNYHRKTGWKKTRGHRQELTSVEITGIGSPSSKTQTKRRDGEAEAQAAAQPRQTAEAEPEQNQAEA
jgi:large subunit ribosomal protein L21